MGVFTEKSPNASESYVDNSVSNISNEINETINTVSGALNTSIQNQTFTGLADTPDEYEDGYYLTSTVSGMEWSDIAYNLDGGSAASVYGGTTGIDGGNASSF